MQNQINKRIARFADLKPLQVQQDKTVPQEAFYLVYARQLLPVVGLASGEETPISDSAPVNGAAGMTMTMAVCPPGQGPGLHSHKETYETFTVMKGEFEFSFGEAGQSVTLQAFDVVSVPPGVYRAFRNVSQEEAVLQVVISGGVHDMNDIVMHPDVANGLREVSPEFFQRLVDSGIDFAE